MWVHRRPLGKPPSLNRPLNRRTTTWKRVMQSRYDETVGSCRLTWRGLPLLWHKLSTIPSTYTSRARPGSSVIGDERFQVLGRLAAQGRTRLKCREWTYPRRPSISGDNVAGVKVFSYSNTRRNRGGNYVPYCTLPDAVEPVPSRINRLAGWPHRLSNNKLTFAAHLCAHSEGLGVSNREICLEGTQKSQYVRGSVRKWQRPSLGNAPRNWSSFRHYQREATMSEASIAPMRSWLASHSGERPSRNSRITTSKPMRVPAM